MSNDWQHLQSLFHSALSLEAQERSAYLANECGEDKMLRHEVESLIAAFESGGETLDESVLSLGLQILSSDVTEESLTGRVIGSFKIGRRLGVGGMGEVYLAEDAKLSRNVALKFLSRRLADNQWAKRQFI